MEPEIQPQRSLPPLVEGKIHGYLKLVIDEVVWTKKSFGDIKVFASWWGETVSALFRPVDITKSVTRSIYETTEIYVIRTNINLFQEYVENCEGIELTVVSEEGNVVIGTSRITNLLKIFELKPYFKYVSIINEFENKIGEIHVSMKLDYATKFSNMQLKIQKHIKDDGIDNIALVNANSFKYSRDIINNNDLGNLEVKESEVYKSILKSRRMKLQKPLIKGNKEVMDKLVAQLVARAQRLRGAILRESCNEDDFVFSDNSLNNSLHGYASDKDNIKFCEYILGKELTGLDESKALCIDKSNFPTTSLTNSTSNSFNVSNHSKKEITSSSSCFAQANSPLEKILEDKFDVTPKENLLLNHINSIRVFVKSFTLTSAGYRRVKSSSSSHNDTTTVYPIYFVQYDMTFDHIKTAGKKSVNNNKSIRICSRRQRDQDICFNHDGIYEIPKLKLNTEYFIRFKIFIRHFNKKSLTELGAGIMSINDVIKSENWSTTRYIIIANKGIKIGELSVIVELGLDFIHFGKQCIDNIYFKENIHNLKAVQEFNQDKYDERNKSAMNIQSDTHGQVSSISAEQINCVTTDNDLDTTINISYRGTENSDSKENDVKKEENNATEKVLLQGFVHIAEGKDLSELNTYLICRAFWKEDKSESAICNNTKNPFYQFSQIVPVVRNTDSLNLMKNNYIIIEVYYRNDNNVDNILGLAKLPIHPLYVAYRNPHVLPHLLLSKYPVVSVDEWVPIIDPVTGQSHGQLLALVALGTTEQITLLQNIRNLQNVSNASSCAESFSEFVNHPQKTHLSQINVETISNKMGDHRFCTIDSAERKACCLNLRTQECQTDISTIEELKLRERSQEEANSEDITLHTSMNCLMKGLNIDEVNSNNEISLDGKEQMCTNSKEQICISNLNFNSSYYESDSNSIKHNYRLPTEMYRSVGVGAEYEEEVDQQTNINHNGKLFDLSSAIHTKERELMDSECNRTMFRAVVEIECALHLPKLEKINEIIEPSTYVSFQANKCDPSKHLNSYMITNVFPRSCNPKWNWKCDVKLPAEKRLILKIWRLLDSDASMQVNLEKDIVIGFSAIDISVLISGFPTISGWFHIMDFSGECNGQIKVSIAPLDNLSLFRKPTLSTTRISTYDISHLSHLPLDAHEIYSDDTEKNNNLSMLVQEETSEHNENQSTDSVTHVSLEDVSMSFLSSSLKKKLTELNEITKRLESRLRDVTNTAFEDYIESEFDLNESNSDAENNDYKSADPVASITVSNDGVKHQVFHLDKKLLQNTDVKVHDNKNTSNENQIQNCLSSDFSSDINKRKKYKETTGSCSSYVSNSYSEGNVINDNCQKHHRNEYLVQNIRKLDNNSSSYPERGTKTHINYLLDKLSLQFPLQSHSTITVPMRINTNLLTDLPQSNNYMQNNNTCAQEFKASTILKETNSVHEQGTFESQVINCPSNGDKEYNNGNLYEVSSQSEIVNKMSTVIREELVSEEDSNTSKCDELTTYLIASNIRHMDPNNIFNPLLCSHLIPDTYCSHTSPEEEAIERLDNRYTEAFITSVNDKLDKIGNVTEIYPSSLTNAELFTVTPSGTSESIDNNLNVNVLRKISYTDLPASNSTESTTTISPQRTSVKQVGVEITECSYSTSSEALDLVLSRQAPDGGNPMEDVTKQSILQRLNDGQGSSSNTLRICLNK
ncbi:uncharacterized protein LOC116430234 isoform X2 [Nomia melanderi]|uniref:uncharacterized protein LOC116430234 isoform X2 n=1 Tax=Nomia melanderi TaxID=2448451 RepID=UPI0013041D68|nr:C2 domain-containing protein 3 isoform X2 [Nomia melanderi]